MRKFNLSKTYDVVTPESASIGDFAETGFVFKRKYYDLEELKDELNDFGAFEWSSSQPTKHCWITQLDPETNYSDASEYRESIHFNKMTDEQFTALLALIKGIK